jgi:ketosteroid isomerase-like protein
MTSTSELPPTVATYLDAVPDADPAAVAALFTQDAIVTDDGHTYRGRPEIITWRTNIATTFTYTATPLRTEQDCDTIVVIARINGDFPGSPVDLANRFTVDLSGQISSLTIEPVAQLESGR